MRTKIILITIVIIISSFIQTYAQFSPHNRKTGFGIIVGEPIGLTLKVWPDYDRAFVFDLGNSYFGDLRFDVDYLWHFNAFRSRIVNLYAGPGGVLGIGGGNGFWYKGKYHRTSNDLGLGVRGVFGINVIPERTPLEIFFELGVLVGLAPDFGSTVDAALGMRFYP